MDEFYVDLHCHATMRAFNTSPKNEKENLWQKTQNDKIPSKIGKWAWKQSKDVSKFSQSNFYNCIEGKTKVIFDSLYPIEKEFYQFKRPLEILVGKKALDTLSMTAAGFSKAKYKEYKASTDYFDMLCKQYDYLVKNQGYSPCEQYTYKVVNSFDELETQLKTNPNQLNIIITIEGAHALGTGTNESIKLSDEDLIGKLKENIRIVKAWEHPPFFITLTHHFWNQICGHSTTMKGVAKVVCDQSFGLNTGFTEVGKTILKELLSRKNGKRILIDTRHMSVDARKYYINYVNKHNRKHPTDLIPIITSHSAMNGFEEFDHSTKKKDNPKKKKKTDFCAWSLNVSAEEARAIHESKGLAGIILDKGRHSGIKKMNGINKLKNRENQRAEFSRLILDTLFSFVTAINEKSAWDILSIGTDFDGVIQHFDCYDEMSKLPQLKSDLISYLSENEYQKEHWYGYSAEEIIHKLFTQNAMDFLKQNFN